MKNTVRSILKNTAKNLEQIEKVLQSKLDKEEVVALIEEKQERDNKVVTNQQEKQIMAFVKKGMETKTKSLADIVKEQLLKGSVNKDDIRVIIDGKFEENEKLASDRQSRERNIAGCMLNGCPWRVHIVSG